MNNLFIKRRFFSLIHGDQLNMTVLFWYLVKSDLPSVHVYSSYTGHVTFYKVPENTAMFNCSCCTLERFLLLQHEMP